MGLIDYKIRVRELYESLGPRYVDLYLREGALAYLGFLEDFQPRDSSVLDVGCGVGVGAGLISGVAKRFVCLDIACGVLRFPNSLPWVDVVCADGTLPPIRPGLGSPSPCPGLMLSVPTVPCPQLGLALLIMPCWSM